jgi:hypothetical protein
MKYRRRKNNALPKPKTKIDKANDLYKVVKENDPYYITQNVFEVDEWIKYSYFLKDMWLKNMKLHDKYREGSEIISKLEDNYVTDYYNFMCENF